MNRHRRDSHRGQAMVEFALVVSLMVLVMIGIFDLGRVVFLSNDMSHAAREATREASVGPLDCESIYNVVQAQTQGQAGVTVVVKYRDAGSATWATVNCPVYSATGTYDDDPYDGNLGTSPAVRIDGTVAVTVQSSVSLITPIVAQIVGTTINIGGNSSMNVTYRSS